MGRTRLIIAVMLLILSLLLGACNEQPADNSGSESETQTSAKDRFIAFLGLSAEADDFLSLLPEQALQSIESITGAGISIDVDKLAVQGYDLLGDKSLGLDLSAVGSHSGSDGAADLVLSYGDEELKVSAFMAEDALYIDLGELYDSPIRVDPSLFAGGELPQLGGMQQFDVEQIASLSDIIGKFLNHINNAVKGLADSCFTLSSGSANAGGVTVSGVSIYKCVLTADDVKAAASAFKASLENDDELESLWTSTFGEGSWDEFVNSLDTSDDGDEASSDESSDSEDTQDEGIEISISEKDGIPVSVTAEFGANRFEWHSLDGEGGSYSGIVITLEDGGAHFTVSMPSDKSAITVSGGMTDGGVDIFGLSCELTRNDRTYSGDFELSFSDENGPVSAASLTVEATVGDGNISLELSDIVFENRGAGEEAVAEIPAELSLYFDWKGETPSAELSVSVGLQGVLELDATFALSLLNEECPDISVPDTWVSADEIDPLELADALSRSCPELYSLISLFSDNGSSDLILVDEIGDSIELYSDGTAVLCFNYDVVNVNGDRYDIEYAWGGAQSFVCNDSYYLADYDINVANIDIDGEPYEFGYVEYMTDDGVVYNAWTSWVHEDGTEMIQEFYYYPDLETGVFVNHALYTIEGDTISFLFANGETSVLDFELDSVNGTAVINGAYYTITDSFAA